MGNAVTIASDETWANMSAKEQRLAGIAFLGAGAFMVVVAFLIGFLLLALVSVIWFYAGIVGLRKAASSETTAPPDGTHHEQ